MAHYEGDEYCAENCTAPHIGDEILRNAPEVCPECGGNGRACAFGCIEYGGRGRSYEEHEGHTGQEALFDSDTWAGVGRLHHNPYAN